jgi:hypothetical protein
MSSINTLMRRTGSDCSFGTELEVCLFGYAMSDGYNKNRGSTDATLRFSLECESSLRRIQVQI